MASIVQNLRDALAIAWRRARGEFPPEDADHLAIIEADLNRHAQLVRETKLVDGVCPICKTPVEIPAEDKNGRKITMRFMPHEDPEWCKAAAALHVKAVERALEQTREDVVVIGERERYWRRAYDLALRELDEVCGRNEPPPPRGYNEWGAHIEERVRDERRRDRERSAIAFAMYERTGLEPEAVAARIKSDVEKAGR